MPQSPNADAPRGPLHGVKVIDLSNFLAAPSISMYLGDLGAEVIKLERPDGGDEFRNWGMKKDRQPLYFKVINRSKKSVSANLNTQLGQNIVKKLVEDADIIVENYRPGRMEKWGLDYETLSRINPGLIMIRVSGYGQTGPYRQKPGFGTALEGFAGATYISGEPHRPPLLPSFGLADASSGVMGAMLALAALQARTANGGKGQAVEFALYETMLSMLGPFIVEYDQLGVVQERMGSRVPWVAPRNTYRTKDEQWVCISASSDQTFARLCTALGLPELSDDPRFSCNQQRTRNVEALDEALRNAIAAFDRTDLIHRLETSDAVVAPVNSIADIFSDPHIKERENIIWVEDPRLGPVAMQNVVGRFSANPPAKPQRAPDIGEHNREILIDRLGFEERTLAEAGFLLSADDASR